MQADVFGKALPNWPGEVRLTGGSCGDEAGNFGFRSRSRDPEYWLSRWI